MCTRLALTPCSKDSPIAVLNAIANANEIASIAISTQAIVSGVGAIVWHFSAPLEAWMLSEMIVSRRYKTYIENNYGIETKATNVLLVGSAA